VTVKGAGGRRFDPKADLFPLPCIELDDVFFVVGVLVVAGA
jgi:hypothetical protein